MVVVVATSRTAKAILEVNATAPLFTVKLRSNDSADTVPVKDEPLLNCRNPVCVQLPLALTVPITTIVPAPLVVVGLAPRRTVVLAATVKPWLPPALLTVQVPVDAPAVSVTVVAPLATGSKNAVIGVAVTQVPPDVTVKSRDTLKLVKAPLTTPAAPIFNEPL